MKKKESTMANGKYPSNWRQIARSVKIEVDWYCQHCKKKCLTTTQLKTEPKATRDRVTLSVHHIDCNKFNLRRDNLIALCLDCHKKEHHRLWLNKKKRQKPQILRKKAIS
jgi:5-methylcytosine-specific restriction endonuclease McrA